MNGCANCKHSTEVVGQIGKSQHKTGYYRCKFKPSWSYWSSTFDCPIGKWDSGRATERLPGLVIPTRV